jgi:acetolactate synthase-1/2/3 large subunit
MPYNVASYIIEVLYMLGIRRIYGIIGTSILDFIDALYDYREKIRLITTRHEQAAIAMADAEYRVSGNLGVAVVHAGPGFLNTLTSLGVAFKDRVPLLLLSGGVKRRLKGTDAWLEVDQVSISKPLTKQARRVNDPSDVPGAIADLLRLGLAKPRGPVMLEIPEDLWSKPIDAIPNIDLDDIMRRTVPNSDDVASTLDAISRAEKPAIMVCGEAAEPGIQNVVGELAERFGAYIIVSGNARGACDESTNRCLGRVGFGGGSLPADKVLEEADILLVLGDELDDIATYGYSITPKGDLVVVSENPAVDRRPLYYVARFRADPALFARSLLELARSRGARVSRPAWDDEVAGYIAKWRSLVEEALSRRYEGHANPAKFFKILSERLPEKSVVTGGQGVHVVYTYAFMKFRAPRRFLAATNLGAMGYAFPAALGAKLALPDHEVIAVVGDGDFMMSIQDLETASREKIPVKVVVVNDNSYRVLLMRQKIQKRGRILGTLLDNPSFEILGKIFGGDGATITRDSDIEHVVDEMLASDKPYVVDLIISQDDMPPLNIDASIKMSS